MTKNLLLFSMSWNVTSSTSVAEVVAALVGAAAAFGFRDDPFPNPEYVGKDGAKTQLTDQLTYVVSANRESRAEIVRFGASIVLQTYRKSGKEGFSISHYRY